MSNAELRRVGWGKSSHNTVNKEELNMELCWCKEGKVRPTTGHEGLEGKQMYSCALLLSSALDVLGGQLYVSAIFFREKHG